MLLKINKVASNNRKKAFELTLNGKKTLFPYVKLRLKPTTVNCIKRVYIDRELADEAFTYVLKDGRLDSIHADEVLEYNRDPNYLRDINLYKLTIIAQKHLKASRLHRREIIRRLGTSASQFYRLLDQTNYKKSIDQLISLLDILGYSIYFSVKKK